VHYIRIDIGSHYARDLALEDTQRSALGGRTGTQVKHDSVRRDYLTDPGIEGYFSIA
jgi:hypothetical protein